MDPVSVTKAVEQFAAFLTQYFVALAAVGALAMALIEFWKKLRDSKARFHAKRLTTWLYAQPEATERCKPPTEQRITAFAELLHLTTAIPMATAHTICDLLRERNGRMPSAWRGLWTPREPEYALFGFELEAMLGYIRTAADTALSYPQRYPSLYEFMAGGAHEDDVRMWKSIANASQDGNSAEGAKLRAELYSRLQTLGRRKVDAIGLFIGQTWANQNQRQANVVGAACLFAALWWTRACSPGATAAGPVESGELVGIAILAILGGALSPIAKDLITALKRVGADT